MKFVEAVATTRIIKIFSSLRLDNTRLRRIFLTTVVLLALKILLYDFLWKGMMKG